MITLIVGPTAIGKSAYSIELAKKTGAEIISADAFQVYRDLSIGTAKMLPHDQCGIRHHLVDIKAFDESYSVGEFLQLTNEILANSTVPQIICGGTGFYLHSFLHGLQFHSSPKDEALRRSLDLECLQWGLPHMWGVLSEIDPIYAQKVNVNDQRRIVRGIELFRLTGQPPTALVSSTPQRRDVELIGLDAPRDWVYDRINQRVDVMISEGFIEEVAHLKSLGFGPQCQSYQALGYPEVDQYLSGSLGKLEMIELIKMNTRRFAKRQYTWFKRFEHVKWLKVT